MSDQSNLFKAVDLLEKSNKDKNLRYHLCASLIQGGRKLSDGFNHSNSKPWAIKMRNMELSAGLQYKDIGYKNTHAEMDAIYNAIKFGEFRNLAGSKLYVARTSGHNLAMARPCEMCQAILYRYGVRKVVYTINPTHYGYLRILASGEYKEEIHVFR